VMRHQVACVKSTRLRRIGGHDDLARSEYSTLLSVPACAAGNGGVQSTAAIRLADLLVVRGFSHRAVSQVVLQAGVPELIDGTCLPEDTTLVGIGQEARGGSAAAAWSGRARHA